MENIGENDSFATEHQPMDMIESAEKMPERNDSLDCAASSLVKTAEMNQQYMATAIDGTGNLSKKLKMEIDANESSGEPLKEEKLELMDVNDDCLRFILKQLPILDLISVADACKRLRSIAQGNFWLAKPIVRIPEDICRRNRRNEYEAADKDKIFQTASRLFRNFGSLMTELKIESGCSLLPESEVAISELDPGDLTIPYDKKIVALIIKYCSQNLIALKLFLVQMRKLPIGLKPIFRTLRKLDFYSRKKIDPSVLKWLTIVEDLRLDSEVAKQGDALIKCSFPNLQRISLGWITIDSNHLNIFLNKHKKIKEICFKYLDGVDNRKLELPVLIEKLSLQLDNNTFRYIRASSFRNLKNLKSLKLGHVSIPSPSNYMTPIIREVVAGNIQLKHLTLKFFLLEMDADSWELCDVVSKLIHLDTLTLDGVLCHDVDTIKQLSPKLHRLKELQQDVFFPNRRTLSTDGLATVVSCFPNLQRFKVHSAGYGDVDPDIFDSAAFEKIVTIVQNRNNNTRLDMFFIGHVRYWKLEIPDDLAKRNRHILSVEQRWRM